VIVSAADANPGAARHRAIVDAMQSFFMFSPLEA